MKLLKLIYLLLICFLTNAQIPNLTFEHLTVKEGLPSNDIWQVSKDKQGFLWIGTGRGICRYDGYNFQTFDDRKLGYCSGISIDKDGDIYTSIDTKGLCKIDHKTLKLGVLLANNYDDDDLTNDLHEEAFIDSYNQVWVGDNSGVKRYDPITKKIFHYPLSQNSVYQFNSFFEDSKHNLWIVSELGLFRFDRSNDKITCILGKKAINLKNSMEIGFSRAFEDAENNIWFGAFRSGLIKYSIKHQNFTFYTKGFENQEILCGSESVNENGKKVLFIGTKNGMLLFDTEQNTVLPIPEFYNKAINIKRFFDDKENGILWISTREGLYKYRYRNLGIRTLGIPSNLVPFPVGIVDIIQLPQEHIMLGLSHTGALDWNRTINKYQLYKYPYDTYINRLRFFQNQVYAFTQKGVWLLNNAKNKFQDLDYINKAFNSVNFNDGLIDKKGRFWVANKLEGLKVFDPKTKQELTFFSEAVNQKLFAKNYVELMKEGIDGKIWVATCSNGLYYFDETKADFVNTKQLEINKGKELGGLCINDLQINENDGSILLASWGGVTKLSKSGEILVTFEYRKDPLLDTYCSNICEDDNGNFWFTTNEDIHIANPKTRKISHFTPIEGLKGNYPVGFLYNSYKELMIGFNNLFNVLNINKLTPKNIVPKIQISSIEIDGKPLQDLSNDIILQANENAITLNFSTLNFEPNSKNIYKYQLVGFNDTWVDLGNKNTISFTNLDPKIYQLKVESGNTVGLWNDKSLIINIVVKPYFYETIWFKLIIAFVSIALLFSFLRWRVNTINEKNQLTLQMSELKLKALQSQMNPHFLFNSLNSVQNYILTNRGIDGAKFLSKFSKLVRQIMENSNHQYLRFEQIIETLKMYVEIESFRFNHEFHYEFNIEENEILLDSLLPPMLLQPYVENAIWHGLMPKEGNKNLIISAIIKDNHIFCQIEDNGIGRSKITQKEGHISRGQEMTKGIFDLLKNKDSEAKLEVIDLVDVENRPIGTRVDMVIPIEK